MIPLSYLLVFQALLVVAFLLWMQKTLFDLPRRLRKKKDAFHYESMAEAYERRAQDDPRYQEFADYYRQEYNKRRKWLE